MGSSRPTDRSLGEATFLPQWMKGKFDTRFDYSEGTFSPPADDTFFCIHYPKYQESANASSTSSKEGFRPISEILGTKTEATDASSKLLSSQVQGSSGGGGAASKDSKRADIDFSKHPTACHPFVPIAEQFKQPKIIVANKIKTKHEANDDEFLNAKSTECGRSILHVANQIMSSKFGKSISSDSSSGTQQQQQQQQQQLEQHKTFSRSLPATPLASPNGTPDSSPKSRRRMYGNRFFTGTFVPDPNGEQRQKSGWLLNILGQSREIVVPKIEEEEEQFEPVPARALSRKKSISSQNLTYVGKEENKSPTSQSSLVNKLQPKPSELREMNFWSPTSM